MIHLFKKSDGGWVFSGSNIPSNMEGPDYVEGVLPEGETWDYEYNYTCVDGVAVKGNKFEMGFVEDTAYIEDRIQAYPSIEDQLDDIYHNGIDGWKETIKEIKDKYPKPDSD